MARQFILAIDQGSTSTRAMLFGADRSIVASAQLEIAQSYPRSGWVEHDPDEIWRSVCQTMRAVLEKSGTAASEVAGIGIANQRETVVVWDRSNGAPIYPAIVWQDRRTAEVCDALRRSGAEPWVREKTGLVLDPYFSATKIAWILDRVDGARERAAKGELAAGTIDSFLLWRLTGGASHRTDATNASRTHLFDIRESAWDDELCSLFRVPRPLLPEVGDNASAFGSTRPEILGDPIPVLGMAGDQQSAALGQACFTAGSTKATFGTGSFILLNTGTEFVQSNHNLLTTVASRMNGKTNFALEGSVFIAGAAVQWLRDGLKIIDSASATGAMAAEADTTQTVVLVPAFSGLGAPYWEPNARGAMFGLNRNTGTKELARATLEAVCFQTRDLLLAMTGDYPFELEGAAIRVDGGFVASDWAMQFQSDILGCAIDRPLIAETTALGAAWLAGQSLGLWPDTEAYTATWKLQRRFQPSMSKGMRAHRYEDWRAAVEATLLYAKLLGKVRRSAEDPAP